MKIFVLTILAIIVIALIGWLSYRWLAPQDTLIQKTGTIMESSAPAISPQDMTDYNWDGPPPGFLDTAQVHTTDGQIMILTEVMAYPLAGAGYIYPNGAIYSSGDYLYSYADGKFRHLPNSDAKSFRIVDLPLSYNYYAKDKNNVYCKGVILPGSDAATFQEVPNWIDQHLKTVVGDKNQKYDGNCSVVTQ